MANAADTARANELVDDVSTTIVRRILAGCDAEFADWIQTGLGLARLFPGFLGGGWLKESSASDVCVILLKFETQAALDNWLTSSLRAGWLRTGRNIAVDAPAEQVSNIKRVFGRLDSDFRTDDQPKSPGIDAPDGIPSPR
ncbi:hypothetical protein [Rhodococcus sp. NPDC049939]|uniref:antibiotic biosynthesis monooxygenase n=1 Tax=Rhodococcus sp. NPDC049939 TaxID=3155511 RepID=UPI0033DC7D68